MNRDFEIKQLLCAYRKGMLSEAAFEEEITRLEREAPPAADHDTPAGFRAFGRVFRSEREAVAIFLDRIRAAQAESAVGFARWAEVCRTPGLRTPLWMIAEREAYHARIFERRLHEIGAELRALPTEHERQLVELLANPEVSDSDKLLWFVSEVPDPKEAIGPIVDFAGLLTEDLETRQVLRLLAEDELSTTVWLRETCVALSQNRDAGGLRPPAHQ
ncbi:MAG TPA: hypothetical protein VMA09_01810 [Candidatus Binataceae bacterium]|nr:hypothetical protein [Candidatus Binataceae bacterium]